HGPGPRVRLRIVDSEVDLQVAERRTPEALDDLRFPRVRAAVHVEPAVERTVLRTAQVIRLDNEIVAFPVAHGVAVPPRLRLALRRQLTAVEIDVAQAVIGFVLDQYHLIRMDDAARL